MSGWCRRTSLVLLLAAAAAASPQAPAERVGELYGARLWSDALAATDGIEDRALRAEWRFQILYGAGDLPAALRAAREGLAAAPTHLGLLQNALVCALTLRLPEPSRALLEQWDRALAGAALEDPASSALKERRERLAADVQALTESDQAARQATHRARAVAIGWLALVAAALSWLALKDPRGS